MGPSITGALESTAPCLCLLAILIITLLCGSVVLAVLGHSVVVRLLYSCDQQYFALN